MGSLQFGDIELQFDFSLFCWTTVRALNPKHFPPVLSKNTVTVDGTSNAGVAGGQIMSGGGLEEFASI